ncbi:MAG: T9SS type A sorting domain-containing protein [Bacteroidetes bacterium]|nr:T9SS type A sorting domain-containing protein [Bacteroidota bacterium]
MKKILPLNLTFIFLLIFTLPNVFGQGGIKERAVSAYATITENPPKIILNWETNGFIVSTQIYRKLKTEVSFPVTPIATINAPSNSYSDEDVEIGTQYDYLFVQQTSFTANNSAVTFAWGELSAGIKIGIEPFKGKLLLVADTAIQINLAEKFERFINDLIEDGWVVSVADKTDGDSVKSIKTKISEWYQKDKNYSKAVILLGNIPVPYSGNFGSFDVSSPPDGHVPDHNGAWVADVYYGIMNESGFTDYAENTGANREANKNRPDDGKFDQSFIPDNVDLQIGRIDMSNLDAVGLNYIGRTERYLDKDHAYRNKQYVVPQRYIFEDRLGLLGTEAPGRLHFWQRGLFEKDSIKQVSNVFFSTVKSTPCLWSGVTTSAGYTSLNGIGSVNEFKDTVYSVFSNYFGSYFGDWDNNNNFLRGSIAGPGYTLTSVWDGRPMYHFCQMALGENIGFSLVQTQNNQLTNNSMAFYPGIYQRGMYLSLLGDPTLRLHTVYPVSNLDVIAINDNKKTKLTWNPSPEQGLEGYIVYRSNKPEGPYYDITHAIITETQFTDDLPIFGDNYYMVKAVKYETTPSGTYYNVSQGRRVVAKDVDGINAQVSVNQIDFLENFKIYPNPSKGELKFVIANNELEIAVKMTNIEGREVANFVIDENSNSMNFENLTVGVYFIHLRAGNNTKVIKWIKL